MRRPLLAFVLVSAAVIGLLAIRQPIASSRQPTASSTASAERTVVLLGNRALFPHLDRKRSGRAVAFRFTALRSGVAHAIRVYAGSAGRARSVSAGIYTNVRDSPRRLLTHGSVRHVRAGRWSRFPIRAVRIHRGRTYWVALLATRGTLAYRDRRTKSCQSAQAAPTRLRHLPSQWRRGRRWHTCSLSAYVSGVLTTQRRAPAPPAGGGSGGGGSGGGGSGGGGSGGGLRTLQCFSSPGACGYPDPARGNVGVPAGTALSNTGQLTITTPGTVINGRNFAVTGTPAILVRASNVTIENSRFTLVGGGCGTQDNCGNALIKIDSGTGTTISHDEFSGSRSATLSWAIWNGSDTNLHVDHIYNHDDDGLMWSDSGGAISDSYSRIELNIGNDHLEHVYSPGDGNVYTLNHDTLENQAGQTSGSIFGDSNGGSGGTCDNHQIVTNNLLVGGGYVIYECGNADSQGSAWLHFENNDIARCTTRPIVQNSDGGSSCNGAQGTTEDAFLGGSADKNGFWPFGGHYGVDSYTYCAGNGTVWSGNHWDDNGGRIGC